MKKKFDSLLNRRVNREAGFTLVEILVAVALLAVVAVVVSTTLINASETNDKFTKGTVSQGQLLNGISTMTREISMAKEITYASETAVAMKTIEDGVEYREHFILWSKGDSVPFADVDTSKIPGNGPSLVEYKIRANDTANPTVRVLVENYNSGANATNPLFKYFDEKNEEMLLSGDPARVLDNDLATIERVKIHFTSLVEGRENPQELATSAVPRSLTGDASAGTAPRNNKISAPVLRGTLPPRTQVANLDWTAIAGATNYTLSRENDDQATNPQVAANPVGGNNTSFADPGRTWGETYAYQVQANSPYGPSDPSNTVMLTVVPEKPAFVGVNTGATNAAGNTVARGLVNRLSWTQRNGATGYYVQKQPNCSGAFSTVYTATSGTTTTWADTANYGQVNCYVVIAFNPVNPDNGSGGNSFPSDPVRLVSPPAAPVISAVISTDDASGNPRNNVTTNVPANTTGHRYYRAATTTMGSTPITSTTATSRLDSVTWGSTWCYGNRAYNAAGDSPVSNIDCVDRGPGPFSITKLSNPDGYANLVVEGDMIYSLVKHKDVGTIDVDWSQAAGATKYTVTRDITNTFGSSVISSAEGGATVTGGANTSVTLNRSSPGVVYTFTVRAEAANGQSRIAASKTLLTRPDVPRSGNYEAVCLPDGTEGSAQTYAHFIQANTLPRFGESDATQVRTYRGVNKTVSGTTSYAPASSIVFWNRIPYQEVVGYKVSNTIASKTVDFGNTAAERTSTEMDIEGGVWSHFGGGCNWSRYYDSISFGGDTWVIPIMTCYGYRPGTDYGRAYYDASNLRVGASWTRSSKFPDSNAGNGCQWRYHPDTGNQPAWASK